MSNETALLVIDVQEAVLEECADVPGVVERINGLLRRARQAGVPVVFIQHQDEEITPGSPGWQLAAGLDRREGEPVVAKTHPDSFAGTDLDTLLADSAAQRLILTGAQSDFCVQTTAQSALLHGYDITLVSDAHTTAPAALPGGELAAETIIQFVNARFQAIRQPGRSVEVLSAADVVL
jgi:nicotinamidase-related amidase